MPNKEKEFGQLFLIPSSLDQEVLNEFLIAEQKKQLQNLSYFIVEKEKAARKMLKKMNLATKIQELTLFTNTQQTNDSEINEMLLPIFNGISMGLLSDSGAPCIADPGNKIVAYAHKKGISVKPLVGPSSIILSLMSSGFNGQNFIFRGYLPKKSEERFDLLKEMERDIINSGTTQIFIETPYRNNDLLKDLLKSLDQEINLCLSIDLMTSNEKIISQSISKWIASDHLDINKRLCIFLLN
jgi:16S rRNA (cytidine1402-2'-O)-methyltransferase